MLQLNLKYYFLPLVTGCHRYKLHCLLKKIAQGKDLSVLAAVLYSVQLPKWKGCFQNIELPLRPKSTNWAGKWCPISLRRSYRKITAFQKWKYGGNSAESSTDKFLHFWYLYNWTKSSHTQEQNGKVFFSKKFSATTTAQQPCQPHMSQYSTVHLL